MSNQILISSGAKVRDLDGVLTGTTGIVSSVPLGAANGVATLDSGGKVPVSQLPASVVTYLGTWNAATNTPTLANGTGDAGDMYLCNVAGTVNFGAGPITFAVGDWVLYGSGTWQKSNGQNGTVTSVAVTESGDALSITGSPITTSGTINIGFAGTTAQYINGAGGLTTFPSLSGYLTAVTATSPLLSSGGTTPDISIPVATSSADGYLDSTDWSTFNNKQNAITLTTTGTSGAATLVGATLNIPNYSTDLSGYVPYTGATTNVNLGTHSLTAADLVINHSSGSGVAASITKGGNGEALTVVKSSGSGNAASITGGVTLLDELHLNTDLADAYIASAANWNTAYNNRITSATSPLSIASNVISIALANSTTSGYLSSTDWNTFNNKQSALTNPVTGTGNSGYVSIFTGTSTIGNSIIFQSSTRIGIMTASPSTTLDVNGGGNFSGSIGALSFVKSGGTSSQFLKADGSVDSNTYVTTDTTQTITGFKTFTNGVEIASAGGSNQNTSFRNTSSLHSGSAGLNVFGFNGSNNIYFGKGLTNGGVFLWNNSEVRYYTLPDANGTIALTTDLSGYLPLSGGTLTGALTLSSASTPLLQIVDTTNSKSLLFGADDSNTFIRSSSSTPILLQVNGGDTAMTLASSGNVGIGTTTPETFSGYRTAEISATAGGIVFAKSTTGSITAQLIADNGTSSGYVGTRTNHPFSIRTNNTDKVNITSSGNVGIGTSSPNSAGVDRALTISGTSNSILEVNYGSTRGAYLYSNSINTVLSSVQSVPLVFKTSDSERMRITAGGFTKSSNDGTYYGSTGTYHEIRSSVADWTTIMSNTNAVPSGLFIQYVNASPNNGSSNFFYFRDSGLTVRAIMYSNGGLANFQANNVNLSDERTKKDIIPLESYWDKFKAIEIVKFKYKDQTHDDFNIGVIAQQVEAVAPEFVDTDGWDNNPNLDEDGNEIISDEVPLKSIYTSDLHHATIKVLQEAMAKIEVLEAKIKQLENK